MGGRGPDQAAVLSSAW